MKTNTKRILAGSFGFLWMAFMSWLGGIEFERGPSLAVAWLASTICFIACAILTSIGEDK